MSKFLKGKKTVFDGVKDGLNNYVYIFLILNIVLVLFQAIYSYLRFSYLNNLIPFWYSKLWGESQLASRVHIFLIPLVGLIILIIGFVLLHYSKKYYLRFSKEILLSLITIGNLILSMSLIRIINIASTPFKPLINPNILDLVIPFAVSFVIVILITPRFLDFAKKNNLITDPAIHFHPGMILTKPSARGGGLVFTIAFIITAIIFVSLSKEVVGILIFSLVLALIGLLDDYQNTHVRSKFRLIENPVLRLFMICVIVIGFVLFFGIKTNYISNPLGGVIKFEEQTINIGGTSVAPLSTLFTIIWIVWILNLLSWSNGIDGQYAGIVGIVGILIAVLAMRFVPLQANQFNLAKLAVIMSGAGLGLVIFTWHPSKIMWGFGAMSAGLIIAALSILINSKIATSVTIIMLPFLDALVTVTRRILQKKNPFRGDKGHLHHLLMERGWSVKKIAVFYWFTTAVLGITGIVSSESAAVKVSLFLGGIVAFGIILLNLRSITMRHHIQQVER
jgi:UDP-GlcNAc:undecaprenyl-phosphate/decaprenyl-phosphate GlcNAc-1-phosphate transferase